MNLTGVFCAILTLFNPQSELEMAKEEKIVQTCEVEMMQMSTHPPALSHMTTTFSKCLNSWIIHTFRKWKLPINPVGFTVRALNVQLSYPVHLSFNTPPLSSLWSYGPACCQQRVNRIVVLSAPDVDGRMKVRRAVVASFFFREFLYQLRKKEKEKRNIHKVNKKLKENEEVE